MIRQHSDDPQTQEERRTMGAKPRVLVIGPTTLHDALSQVVPGPVDRADHLLEGIWRCGHEPYDSVFLSLAVGGRALSAVRALRQVVPDSRIIVACEPTAEPMARQALQEGADEYVLEPIQPDDVTRALHLPQRPEPPAPEPPVAPSQDEIVGLSEVLRNLHEGLEPTLERLAGLIRTGFGAEGAMIELDDYVASDGEAGQPVLQERIVRGGRPAGRILLSRCARGAYAADAARRLAQYARLVEAVTAQVLEQQRWKRLAWRDDLTGLYNRRYFQERLKDLLEEARRDRRRVTVLLFDIDDFKTYNDRYGHATGDDLLREVAQLLTHCTREHDVVVRYGGDEFAVIFRDSEPPRVPGSQHPREPVELTERFRRDICQHDFTCLGRDRPGPVTISGGLATFPWDANDWEELVAAADTALLSAKKTGKNRIHLAGGGPADTDTAPTGEPAA